MKGKDADRDHRIDYEVIVDCYDDDEVAMGWYYYLSENMSFPFKAEVVVKQRNGTKIRKQVDVLEFEAEEGDWDMNFQVGVAEHGDNDVFYVPVLDLENMKANAKTMEVVEDWRYWNQ